MGLRNVLIEGPSGSGKTSVAEELQRRGYHAIHGDRELAYKGDPVTGQPVSMPLEERTSDIAFGHRHHIWDVEKVRALVADVSHPISFFCGGSRNHEVFIALFDHVFILEVDRATLMDRLARRDETEFGGRPEERAFITNLHASKEDLPVAATRINAEASLAQVVDTILMQCGEMG